MTAARTLGVVDVRNHLEVDGFDWTYDPYVDTWWSSYPGSRPYYMPVNAGLRFPALSDGEIADEIRDDLWWSPFVDADQVKVRVEDGVAYLTGTVDSWSEYLAATENGYEDGAVRVHNRLRVGGGSGER